MTNKFKNNKTGNVLNIKNKKTITLMEKSERYTRVDKTSNTDKKSDKTNK